MAAPAMAPVLEQQLEALYQRWAQVYYLQPATQREAGMRSIIDDSIRLREAYPGEAEPLIMEAVARSAWAEKAGRLKALEQAKIARGLLEQSVAIDPLALSGAAWVTLGTLYYRVPGWPLGFGDDDKAREYLEKALRIDADNIDAYFFYGEFLAGAGDAGKAREMWNRALSRPVRARFPVADAGRRRMIRDKLGATR